MQYDDAEDMQDDDVVEKPTAKGLSLLAGYIAMKNIADALEDDELAKIGAKVVQEYDTDFESMEDWLIGYNKGVELAKLTKGEKNTPWQGAANMKYPLIANAAMKFAARAYPEIVRNSQVVSCRTIGDDQEDQKHKRGKRVAEFMNWQLLVEMNDWDADMDRMLTMLPVCGQLYKKIFFNPILKRNVSELVKGDKLIVNQQAQSWERARRRTHVYELYHNEVIEMQRAGLFLECTLSTSDSEDAPDDKIHEMLEQHRFLDLDDDGYDEPYIVTVHKETGKVLRIVARYNKASIVSDGDKIISIRADEHFTPYGFLPSFDGSLHCIGFGHLIYPLNEAANTIINQLMDAGTLANVSGGFIGKGLRIGSGNLSFKPGEWKPVNASGDELAKSIYPMPSKEASPTLFNLLSMVIEAANEMAAVKDVLSGDSPGANVSPTTVLALIEQGQKTFNSIYKRIWRSLGDELRKLYRLDSKYLDINQYLSVLDDPDATPDDFSMPDNDIIPVADPTISSQAQRMAQAQAAMQISGRPGVDESLLTNEFLKALGHPKADVIAPHIKQDQIKPLLEQAKQQGIMEGAQQAQSSIENEIKEREVAVKEKECALKAERSEMDMDQISAQIQKTVVETLEKLLAMPPAIIPVLEAEANQIYQPHETNEYETDSRAIPEMEGTPGDDAYYGNPQGMEGNPGITDEGYGAVDVPQFPESAGFAVDQPQEGDDGGPYDDSGFAV